MLEKKHRVKIIIIYNIFEHIKGIAEYFKNI